MFPVIVHPVFVNAVVLATPTSPAVVDLVQVTAGPPRIAKLNTEPPDCAAALLAVTSSAPNDATTANFAVSRGRENIGFLLTGSGNTGRVPGSIFDIGPRSPRPETCRRGRRAEMIRRGENRLTTAEPTGCGPWAQGDRWRAPSVDGIGAAEDLDGNRRARRAEHFRGPRAGPGAAGGGWAGGDPREPGPGHCADRAGGAGDARGEETRHRPRPGGEGLPLPSAPRV